MDDAQAQAGRGIGWEGASERARERGSERARERASDSKGETEGARQCGRVGARKGADKGASEELERRKGAGGRAKEIRVRCWARGGDSDRERTPGQAGGKEGGL